VFARSNKNILFKMGTAIIKELFKSDWISGSKRVKSQPQLSDKNVCWRRKHKFDYEINRDETIKTNEIKYCTQKTFTETQNIYNYICIFFILLTLQTLIRKVCFYW
jgi:hypothetical protein